MQPWIVHGGHDLSRQEFAEEAAAEKSLNFISLNAEEVPNFVRLFSAASLEASNNLFFIYDAEKLPSDFPEYIKDSPHLFILSTENLSSMDPQVSKACLKKNLGGGRNGIGEAIKSLMTLDDRDAVRLAFYNVDPIHVFHILKKDSWKSAESIDAMARLSQNIYRVHPSYILSLLAYGLPKKAFPLSYASKQSDEQKMRKEILSKLKKAFRLNSVETADIYLLVQNTHVVPDQADLSDQELSFLGCSREPVPEAPKPASLERFF